MTQRHMLRALAAAVVVVGMGGAGCSSPAAEPKPLPTTSVQPSPTQSRASAPSSPASASTAPTPPALPAAARGSSPAAAEAFVKHWILVLNFSGPAGTSSQLRTLSSAACQDCDAISDFIDAVSKRGGRIQGQGWTTRATHVYSKPTNQVVVQVRVQVHPQSVTTKRGSRPRHFPGGRRLKTFFVSPKGNSWIITRLDQST